MLLPIRPLFRWLYVHSRPLGHSCGRRALSQAPAGEEAQLDGQVLPF